MDLTHLHLLLNHFPSIGFLIGLAVFVFGLVTKSNDLKRASLLIFLGIGLLTIPTYMSGNAAEEGICAGAAEQPCPDAGVSRPLIQAHEGAALIAFVLMQFTGALAWLGLWQFRRSARFRGWNLAALLVLSLLTLSAMVRTSNLGGEIRHPEIRTAQAAPGEPVAREVGAWVTRNTFVWPTCETLHFVGLCLLFGVAAMVDLRMLGLMKAVPFSALHRLLPWAILAFGVNLLTGMFFFVADPGQYTQNGAFHWKIVLILLAGLNVVYFTIFDEPWTLQPGEDAPVTAKLVAASALVLVVGVIYCGRMLPFLGNSF